MKGSTEQDYTIRLKWHEVEDGIEAFRLVLNGEVDLMFVRPFPWLLTQNQVIEGRETAADWSSDLFEDCRVAAFTTIADDVLAGTIANPAIGRPGLTWRGPVLFITTSHFDRLAADAAGLRGRPVSDPAHRDGIVGTPLFAFLEATLLVEPLMSASVRYHLSRGESSGQDASARQTGSP